MSRPPWLAPELCYADYGGDWQGFLEQVYVAFERDFKETRPVFRSLPVVIDTRRGPDGREEAFWHLTSRKPMASAEREMDIPRSERVPWVRPIIENAEDRAVSSWRNKRKGETRWLLWVEELDYLVVLAKKRRVFVLVTAYPTDREHTRRKLRTERDSWVERQTPPRGTA